MLLKQAEIFSAWY